MFSTEIQMVGVDIAKHVFHIHATDAAGRAVLQKRVRKSAFLEVIRQIPACTLRPPPRGRGADPHYARPGRYHRGGGWVRLGGQTACTLSSALVSAGRGLPYRSHQALRRVPLPGVPR